MKINSRFVVSSVVLSGLDAALTKIATDKVNSRDDMLGILFQAVMSEIDSVMIYDELIGLLPTDERKDTDDGKSEQPN